VQLYEMSDDVKRKEFLDELFTFMQKRGELVNWVSAINSCKSYLIFGVKRLLNEICV